MSPSPLHLAYYADDFTGATDALETLAGAGLRTALFLDPPTPAQLARHPGLQALGVAGLTRSLAPDAIERTLRPAFAALLDLHPRHVHYKVCSTFDSSPEIGSIGRATEIAREIFGNHVVPLLVAAPALGRYCVFGQLHARYGIGSSGAIHRLDRHPAISRHPVTPMIEADLRLHLGRQTSLKTGLIDILTVKRGPDAIRESLFAQAEEGAAIILIDALTEAQIADIGGVLDGLASGHQPLFSVGSSGLNAALTASCRAGSLIPPVEPALRAGLNLRGAQVPPNTNAGGISDSALHSGPTLVLSGSCSPVTAGQIDWALAHGFTGIELVPATLDGSPLREERDCSAIESTLNAIVTALKSGRPTLVFTSRGQSGAPVPAEKLGRTLGQLAREAIAATGLSRLVFAGGDTSSYAARALGLESVEWAASLVPGAPWCRAYAPGSPADGLLVAFKGGQVGPPDAFGRAAGVAANDEFQMTN